MADCDGLILKVATMEGGPSIVKIPVENWRDVKGVHAIGEYAGISVLHADDEVRIYNGPSSVMLDVCVEMLSADEKAVRDKAAVDALHANVDEVHSPAVEAAAAEAQAARDAREDAEAEAILAANAAVKDAEDALARAKAARDAAHAEVEHG